jgi:hypothetical protein
MFKARLMAWGHGSSGRVPEALSSNPSTMKKNRTWAFSQVQAEKLPVTLKRAKPHPPKKKLYYIWRNYKGPITFLLTYIFSCTGLQQVVTKIGIVPL